MTTEPTTRVTGANDWVDDFQTNVDMGHFYDGDMGYRIFDPLHADGSPNQTQHFVNDNHWMTDTFGATTNGPTLRPNRSFTFENGKLVVETDVAAGMSDFQGDVWPEIDISMAPAPTNTVVDSLYAYGAFGGFWTVGCRLHNAGPTICAIESASPNVTNNPTVCNAEKPSRIMEISDFEFCGPTSLHMGGNRFGDNGQYFRQCGHNQSYDFCLDRFRIELTKSSLSLYVNGHLYFQDGGWDAAHQLPDSMVNGGQVYAYFSDWRFSPQGSPYRFNWGHIAVNPHDAAGNILAPSASPTFCLGQPQNTCPGDASPPPPPNATSGAVTMLTEPLRLVDTRNSGGPIAAKASRCFSVANFAGIPPDATAVLLNVTAVGQTTNGWLTVYPAGQPAPATSTVNFSPLQYATANGTLARIGSGGQVCVAVGTAKSIPGSSQVILDATGFISGSLASPVIMLGNPARVADTRAGGGPVTAGSPLCFPVTGLAGIPGDASAVLLNITAVGYTKNGWLTLFPNGQAVPATSTLNFSTSQYALANGALARVGTGGQVCVNVGTVNSLAGSSHVVLDAVGYVPSSALAQLPMLGNPMRVVDTRVAGGPIPTGSSRCFSLATVPGISPNAVGAVVNVTAIGAATKGWLTVYPFGAQIPTTSTLNFDPSEYAVANSAFIELSPGAELCVSVGTLNSTPGSAQVVLDVVGLLNGP